MRKILSIAFALTIPATIGTALSFITLEAKPAYAQAQFTQLSTYTLRATTNSSGFFTVPHGLSGTRIEGIEVAVQHTNGNWHTLEFSDRVDNRFWWNNQSVEGIIGSSFFYNRPVKIIIFLR